MDAMDERRLSQLLSCCALVAAACAVSDAVATPISERSFFDVIPHTFLDFETDGDGNLLSGDEGTAEFMNLAEYNAFGMRWNGLGTVFWGNPSDPDVEAAIAAAGSPNHVVGWSNGTAGIIFTDAPMRSIGFSLFVDSNVHTDPIRFDAFRADGTVIESFEFGGAQQSGMIGDVAFGFVGLTLDEPMAGIVFFQTLGFAIDDLHFSTVPSPGGAALAAAALGMAFRRRVR